MHIHIANPSEGIALNRGHRDEKSPLGLGAGDESQKLLGVPRLAEENQYVSLGENANVAMEGVDRREEAGGDGEGDEGLGDLPGDEARLADAGEEDGAGAIEEDLGEG